MNNTKWLLGLLIIFLTFLTSSIYPAELKDEPGIESLRGLKGVCVLVESLGPSFDGKLTRDNIKTDVELKLRLAGIKVISDREIFKTTAQPILHVSVFSHGAGGSIGYSINVEFMQLVNLRRDSTKSLLAGTWWTRSSGVVGELQTETLRNSIKDKVDEFINDFRLVNPEGGK
jgi:hypothetical protein